ncbi:hypothetical protein BJ875DRAFT_134185 [Amylocarpus encephaloides]|uniref:Uncharacterized protein n=1 Tax=Amylocarpus encephaloides TaxID=45428 RepID=A0A9P7YDH7_9HELO|nr:hypothetical protein BJ875DRAFT_134185 [Amylocarpus encephaloides]
MKFSILPALVLASVALGATVPQKAVIVSYPDETPDDVVKQAMTAITDAGGVIIHEYRLIKGFAAKAPAKILQQVQTWGNDYNAVIEEDQMVSVAGSVAD